MMRLYRNALTAVYFGAWWLVGIGAAKVEQ